jgi:hypothetical protein
MQKYFHRIDRSLIGLWDFGWLQTVRYSCGLKDLKPDSMLRGFLLDKVFCDPFLGDETTVDFQKHGPFYADRIAESDFQQISCEELRALLKAETERNDMGSNLTTAQREKVDLCLVGVRCESSVCFVLSLDLDAVERRHDSWFVHTLFREFLAIEDEFVTQYVVGFD